MSSIVQKVKEKSAPKFLLVDCLALVWNTKGMGNLIGSLISAFTDAIGRLIGPPLDFLSGKSCSFTCGSTWDLICYIENFCIASLLKLVAVLFLFYIVLVFFYLLFKLGICGCLARGMSKMLCGCCSSCCSALEYSFVTLKLKLRRRKRMDADLIDLERYDRSSSEDDSISDYSDGYGPRLDDFERTPSLRPRDRRRLQMQRSLRPRSHRIRVGIERGSVYVNERPRPRRDRRVKTVHDIRVTKTSKFVQKGGSRMVRRPRW